MRSVIVGAALALSACSAGLTSDKSLQGDGFPVRFNSTLSTTGCLTEIGFRPAPCLTFGSASHTDMVDSGRVVFSTDGTVHWMVGTHTTRCPCYLGGCTTPCYDEAPVVSRQSGTYTGSGDLVVLTFAADSPSTRTLKGTADSLLCWSPPCGVFYPVMFKSP